MALILDSAEHMNATVSARVVLDGSRFVDDLQLVAICGHANVVPGHDCNHGKQSTFGLPALAATAGVIVCASRSHGNLNLVCIAATVQGSTREIIATGMDAVVDGRV